jgi:hypothetical protein
VFHGLSAFAETLARKEKSIVQNIRSICVAFHDTQYAFIIPCRTSNGAIWTFQLCPVLSDDDPRLSQLAYEWPQEVPTRLELSHVISSITKWAGSCDRYHPRCAPPLQPTLPKRVLDISSDEGDDIALKELNGVCASYVSLSYSWGSSGVPLMTTSKTLQKHLRGISWNDLPLTFKDAIRICRALKIRFLWIDSLCILQDDTLDWEQESANMADIYSNSYLTITASSCGDSHKSLFSDRWTTMQLGQEQSILPMQSLTVRHGTNDFSIGPWLHLAHDRWLDIENAHKHRRDAPLLTRAWTFQERLLPSRILHIHAEELVWECRTAMRCECHTLDDQWLRKAEFEDSDTLEVPAETSSDKWLKSLFSCVILPETPTGKLVYIWMDLVAEYSRLDLTYESDRSPALSGLAAKFNDGPTGQYSASMWLGAITISLLFEAVWSPDTPYYAFDYRPQAPSWSWASIPLAGVNAISYARAMNLILCNFEASPHFKTLKHNGKILGQNPFGWVKNAVLTVEGETVRCLAVLHNKSWHLKVRATHMTLSEDEALAELSPDGPDLLVNNQRLLCLHLGSGHGIALWKVQRIPATYRRVGLVILPEESHWSEHMTVKTLDII